MTQEETAELMDRAGACVEECSLDNVGDLIALLQTQQRQLNDRLGEVRDMIHVSIHVTCVVCFIQACNTVSV
jgi:hypothetical protein